MKRVLLVDTSMGNLRSVARALERAGGTVALGADPDAVRAAERVVFPGQGHFRDCAAALDGGLRDALLEHVGAGRPYLGICLGMQILFERSEEAPEVSGLGLFRGEVRRFARDLVDAEGRALKVPHMGWNLVRGDHPLLDAEAWLYFVHSYHCVPEDPSTIVGAAEYGAPFCAAVARDNVFACQFHPEKSQRAGARVLERFLEGAWS